MKNSLDQELPCWCLVNSVYPKAVFLNFSWWFPNKFLSFYLFTKLFLKNKFVNRIRKLGIVLHDPVSLRIVTYSLTTAIHRQQFPQFHTQTIHSMDWYQWIPHDSNYEFHRQRLCNSRIVGWTQCVQQAQRFYNFFWLFGISFEYD